MCLCLPFWVKAKGLSSPYPLFSTLPSHLCFPFLILPFFLTSLLFTSLYLLFLSSRYNFPFFLVPFFSSHRSTLSLFHQPFSFLLVLIAFPYFFFSLSISISFLFHISAFFARSVFSRFSLPLFSYFHSFLFHSISSLCLTFLSAIVYAFVSHFFSFIRFACRPSSYIPYPPTLLFLPFFLPPRRACKLLGNGRKPLLFLPSFSFPLRFPLCSPSPCLILPSVLWFCPLSLSLTITSFFLFSHKQHTLTSSPPFSLPPTPFHTCSYFAFFPRFSFLSFIPISFFIFTIFLLLLLLSDVYFPPHFPRPPPPYCSPSHTSILTTSPSFSLYFLVPIFPPNFLLSHPLPPHS